MASILPSNPHTSEPYEPSPRFDHCAASVGGRWYLWGGHVADFSTTPCIEVFDPYLEMWEKHRTRGVPPPGLYNAACTSVLGSLYWFGGCDDKTSYNFLHRLDTTTLEWRELQPLNQANGPMRKAGCGMVPFLQDHLAIFGGYGTCMGYNQPGSTFAKNRKRTHHGWSNEFHVLNITESM